MFSRKQIVHTALVSALALVPSAVRAQEWTYRPELPLARGFHVEQRPRYGLLIGGGVTFGVGVLMLASGIGSRKNVSASCHDLDCSNATATGLMVVGGVAATLGAVLFVVGLSRPRWVVVPGDPPPGSPAVPSAGSALDAYPKERAPRLSFGVSDVGTGSGFSFQGAF